MKYYVSRGYNESVITSNNPNHIFKVFQEWKQPPIVEAIDTGGFSINEALSMNRIDANRLISKLREITTADNYKIWLPHGLFKLISADEIGTRFVDIDPQSKFDPHNWFHRLIARATVGARLSISYSLLLFPFFLFDVSIATKITLIFVCTLFFSSIIFFNARKINLVISILIGSIISVLMFGFNSLLSGLVIGILWGLFAWILLNR